MAGDIVYGDGEAWMVAGWLFDYVVRELAERVDSVELAALLREIVDENLGILSLSDLPADQQNEIIAHLDEGFLNHINRVLPQDLGRIDRSKVIELIAQLVHDVQQRS